jgi:hypothetical protein
MTSVTMATDEERELRARNRAVLRVLLTIAAVLLVAGLLVGIRW